MCGCAICIHFKQLQRTLSSWIKRHAYDKYYYKYVVFPGDDALHLLPRD